MQSVVKNIPTHTFFNSFWAPLKIFHGLLVRVFQSKESKKFIYFKKKEKMTSR